MESLIVMLHRRQQAETRDDDYGASGVSSADESGDVAAPKKKRRSSYHARKSEMNALRDEAVTLRRELQRQRAKTQPLAVSMGEHAVLRSRVQQSRLAIAGAQSLVSSHGDLYGEPPLECFVHLPRVLHERRRVIDRLKSLKMRDATAYMLARCQFWDMHRRCRQVENLETAAGDQLSIHWEITKFENAPSVQWVYEEMLDFARTQEMSIAERLGVVSIRESDVDVEDITAAQLRILSTLEYERKLLVEKNLVLFSQFFDKSEFLDQPHGLLIVDYVDQDDLYPYRPQERIRKDVSSVTLVLQCPSLPSAVSLVKWSFIRIHRSELATPEELEDIARDGVRTYFDVMLKVMRERLSWYHQMQH